VIEMKMAKNAIFTGVIMSISVNWSNPYADMGGHWLKGNLHTHTSPASGCGEISVTNSVDLYVERGYDFISISDHLTYTRHEDNRITILPGIEWNADEGNCHTGVYSLTPSDLEAAIAFSEQDQMLNDLRTRDALLILNHPNWQLRPHYRREELEQRDGYDGIEIYNGVIERLQGYSIATDKWDYLLTHGRRVLGFASDDSHRDTDIGLAAIYVRSETNSARDILSAIKRGNFYCSNGAIIDDIRLDNGVIELETPNAQKIHVRADGGTCIHRVSDRSTKFDIRGLDLTYVRFAVYGSGSAMAWTQPFFCSRS
jgi:hypothetical protein